MFFYGPPYISFTAIVPPNSELDAVSLR